MFLVKLTGFETQQKRYLKILIKVSPFFLNGTVEFGGFLSGYIIFHFYFHKKNTVCVYNYNKIELKIKRECNVLEFNMIIRNNWFIIENNVLFLENWIIRK